ncbi:MAG: hypothetical protein ABIL58_08045 [Pseudomonadota bacterium]
MLYELLYGTVHCTGRITYSAGSVPTRDEALGWCKGTDGATPGGMRIPETDPLRWCPVRHCHMKRQRPWRAFREIPSAGSTPVRPENA